MKTHCPYLMQTMEYACFAFLQRGPASRTQEASSSEQVRTVTKLSCCVQPTATQRRTLRRLIPTKSSPHRYFASLPQELPSKPRGLRRVTCLNANKDQAHRPALAGVYRRFHLPQRGTQHSRGQQLAQPPGHAAVERVPRRAELSAVALPLARVGSQQQGLRKSTR